MASDEPSKEELLDRIRDVKEKLKATDEDVYNLTMTRKFLRHQLADLQYDLNQKDDICE